MWKLECRTKKGRKPSLEDFLVGFTNSQTLVCSVFLGHFYFEDNEELFVFRFSSSNRYEAAFIDIEFLNCWNHHGSNSICFSANSID